jgi:ankyrin repeat protein
MGHAKLVQLLVDEGAPLDVSTRDGRTPLDAAVERGKPDCAKILLSRGAAADSRDDMGRTTLHRAVLAGNAEIVKLDRRPPAKPQAQQCQLLRSFKL